ncbi:16110_t:CDS:2, partial [Cetraspora pellucida]
MFFFSYCYNNNISICYNTYLALTKIDYTYLENLKQHLQKHGLEEHIYGNTERASKNMNCIEYEKKLEFINNYLAYLSYIQKECNYYNINIKNAVEDDKHNQNIIGPECTNTILIATNRLLCNTDNFSYTQQTNYVINEAEMPNNSKQDKSVNSTLSLVWHAIKKYNHQE